MRLSSFVMDRTDIDRFLAIPARSLEPAELAREFVSTRLGARLRGRTTMTQPMELVDAFRSAFGRACADVSSPEARAGLACPMRPASLSDLLFRNRQFDGHSPMPKPYTVSAQAGEGELEFRVDLFGLATGWALPFGDALDRALSQMSRTGAIEAARRDVELDMTFGSIASTPVVDAAMLRTRSPLRLRSGGVASFTARGLASSLVRRARGLAHWHGASLRSDTGTSEAILRDVDITFDFSAQRDIRRTSASQGDRSMTFKGREGVITIVGRQE